MPFKNVPTEEGKSYALLCFTTQYVMLCYLTMQIGRHNGDIIQTTFHSLT
jgi:hypothetical protein